MLFSPDRDVVVKSEYIQHATELGLVIPTIHVEDHLDKRLERHDRTIEFDGQALFDGTLELELEDPIAVTFGAYRKDIEKPEAEIDYEIKPKNAEVDLDVDATPTFEEGSEKKANIGLWLGVAVADALITHGKEVRSTRDKKRTIHALAATVAGAGANLGSATILNTTIGLQYPLLGVPAQVAVVLGGLIHRDKVYGEDVEEYLEKELLAEAEKMAESFPVVSYGYDLLSNI